MIYTPTQVIGRNLNAVATEYELSGEDLNSFWKGGLVTLYEENRQGQKEPVTIGVDLFTDTGVIVVPGTAAKWENTVRRVLPRYSFGNDGCWLNKDGRLTYVPEEEFTKDILDECQGIHSEMMDVGSIKTGDLPMFLKRSSPKTSSTSWSVLPNCMEWSARHMSYVMPFRNLTFTQTTQKKSSISLCDNIRNTSNTV